MSCSLYPIRRGIPSGTVSHPAWYRAVAAAIHCASDRVGSPLGLPRWGYPAGATPLGRLQLLLVPRGGRVRARLRSGPGQELLLLLQPQHAQVAGAAFSAGRFACASRVRVCACVLARARAGGWQVHPWDKDLTWNIRAFGNGTEPMLRALEHPTLRREYQRRLRQACPPPPTPPPSRNPDCSAPVDIYISYISDQACAYPSGRLLSARR